MAAQPEKTVRGGVNYVRTWRLERDPDMNDIVAYLDDAEVIAFFLENSREPGDKGIGDFQRHMLMVGPYQAAKLLLRTPDPLTDPKRFGRMTAFYELLPQKWIDPDEWRMSQV